MTATPLLPRRRLLAAPALALLLSAGGLVAVHGQEATPDAGRTRGGPFPAHIHAGSCGENELGDVVAPLTDLAAPRGGNEGNRNAIQGANSFTTVPLTLDQILAADHAINVHLSAEEIDQYIACGEIGGTRNADGSLVIGLREMEGSGHSGIAYLSPGADGASTGVSVFVAETAGDRQRDRDRTRGQAGADETPAAAGGETGTVAAGAGTAADTPVTGAATMPAGEETPTAAADATMAPPSASTETPATGGTATEAPDSDDATEGADTDTDTDIDTGMATETPEGGMGASDETPSPVIDSTQPPVIDGTSTPVIDATQSPVVVDVGATATAEAGG